MPSSCPSLVFGAATSVRGAISGSLKKKQGLTITNEKTDDGRRLYRIV